MAISANAVWECRSGATAANANGGFFVTGASGVDYSQQNAAQWNLTSVTSSGAGNTVLSASAHADMVGNGAHVTAGTNFTLTNPWFEVTSVVAGVSITFSTNSAGASICTGVGSGGTINIGGALSLGSSTANATDDIALEQVQPGNTVWIKAGTYAITNVSIGTWDGTVANPVKITGYNTTRGDNPTGANRPVLGSVTNNNNFFLPNYTIISNIIRIGQSSQILAISANSTAYNCKSINTSTTVDRPAFISTGGGSLVWNCEAISYRGMGISCSNHSVIIGNYIHDCKNGIVLGNSSATYTINDNVIASCYNAGITNSLLLASSGYAVIQNNTIYGSEAKMGTGISIITGSLGSPRIVNNIFYGLATGVSHADSQKAALLDFNTFYNCTTDVSNVQKGPNDIALNPNFKDAAQISGSTATTSGSVLTQSGGDFSSVTDGEDYLYLVSGTGVTVGIYGILSHTSTTVTLDIAPGTSATADKVWVIPTSHDYRVGTNMKAAAYPGLFPGAMFTGYKDIGAVQRREPVPLKVEGAMVQT